MTREQIEKVAGEYSGSVFGFKNNPVVMNKHKAFMDGAQWRINSVWHEAETELPESGRDTLVLFRGGGCGITDSGTRFDLWRAVSQWAYVSDILPERKEETNGGR